MRALLDTHAFLWAVGEEGRLSATAWSVLEDGANEIHFSAVSAWEIGIKAGRGRLDLPHPVAEYVAERLALFGFRPLAIEIRHALRVASLPRVHNDPFDRMLVAQAQVEGLPILTSDANIARYEVEVIW